MRLRRAPKLKCECEMGNFECNMIAGNILLDLNMNAMATVIVCRSLIVRLRRFKSGGTFINFEILVNCESF